MKKTIIIIAAALALCSCGGNRQKTNDPLADSGRTRRTENLLRNLQAMTDSTAYMFGHQDDTLYGISWTGDSARSDVKSVCGDYPAVIGFELATLAAEQPLTAGQEPEVEPDRIRQEIITHFDRGGMVTLSWTVDPGTVTEDAISRIADFVDNLVTPYGVKVPVLFRLRGEADKALWQKVINGFREKPVVNALYAYSNGTDANNNAEKYLEHYPGDDYIDLMGLECYFTPEASPTGGGLEGAASGGGLEGALQMLCPIAEQHGKPIALTETGYEGIKSPDWWTHALAPVLSRHKVSYLLVWRNANDKPGHFFAPYPGQQSVSDFVRFYNAPQTLFLKDLNGLYL